jgi:hypothetical protein
MEAVSANFGLTSVLEVHGRELQSMPSLSTPLPHSSNYVEPNPVNDLESWQSPHLEVLESNPPRISLSSEDGEQHGGSTPNLILHETFVEPPSEPGTDYAESKGTYSQHTSAATVCKSKNTPVMLRKWRLSPLELNSNATSVDIDDSLEIELDEGEVETVDHPQTSKSEQLSDCMKYLQEVMEVELATMPDVFCKTCPVSEVPCSTCFQHWKENIMSGDWEVETRCKTNNSGVEKSFGLAQMQHCTTALIRQLKANANVIGPCVICPKVAGPCRNCMRRYLNRLQGFDGAVEKTRLTTKVKLIPLETNTGVILTDPRLRK